MKICDLHNDFLVEIQDRDERINYIKNINKNKKIKYICSAIWTTHLNKPLNYIKNIKNEITIHNKKGKILICIEDLSFINKSNILNSLKNIIDIRPFYCGLVWNFDNKLGGGAFGNKNKGLTKLGKSVVKILENNNIIIDTAHMNKRTFYDFCKITKFKIFNSHSNIFQLKKHKRNLTNKQLKNILKTEGLVGLSFVNDFILKNFSSFSSNDIVKQIKFLIHEGMPNNISFGTDFYGTKNLPNDIKNYDDINKTLLRKLRKNGISNKQINNILYKNFIKFKKNYNKKRA